MAKTYNAVPDKASGDVFTEAMWDDSIKTNINNLRVPPIARVRRSTDQNVNNTTDTVLQWTDMDVDTDSMWSAGSNDRLTIQTAGIYVIAVNVTFLASTTGERIVWIQKNGSGTTRYASDRRPAHTTALAETSVSISTVLSLSATDYIQVGVYQSAGTSTATVKGSATLTTNLAVAWVGQAS